MLRPAGALLALAMVATAILMVAPSASADDGPTWIMNNTGVRCLQSASRAAGRRCLRRALRSSAI
jgi:hypothetical protein